MLIGLSQRRLHRLVLRRQEDDLAVGGFGHRLHGFKVSDLHGRRAGQDVGGLAHEFCGFDLSTRANDLRLTSPLGLRGHGQAVLKLLAEDDILDEHTLHRRAPAGGRLLDDFADRLRDLLAALDHVLQHARTDDVAESGLRTLDERLAKIGDTEGGFVWACDVVVDDGCEGQVDVVFGHADLFWDFDDLNLDVYLDQALGEWVDLDETWVYCSCESTEFGDQTDLTLRNWLVWVGADDAAGDGAKGTDAASEGVDHASVPAMLRFILSVGLDDPRIRWLQILSSWWLDVDYWTVSSRTAAVLRPLIERRFAVDTVALHF